VLCSKVVQIDDAKIGNVWVRLIPRLDLAEIKQEIEAEAKDDDDNVGIQLQLYCVRVPWSIFELSFWFCFGFCFCFWFYFGFWFLVFGFSFIDIGCPKGTSRLSTKKNRTTSSATAVQ
jgi:hypothetical protein